MLPIEKIISKTLNLKPAENTKVIEELRKGRALPTDPRIEKIAAEAEKLLKTLKESK